MRSFKRNHSIINLLLILSVNIIASKKLLNCLTLIIFLFIQIISPVYGANIVDIPDLVPDGSTNTITDLAPNNTPIVNIAPPSASGVSLNNWSDYNVSSQNQILNNAKGATVNTNLAGQIYGNPNFNPSGINEATIIVNQVTSNNRTNLNGATEVAGRKANIVIANANGIDVAGASYINTSALALVNGSVNMNGSGAIDSFTLSNKANSGIIIMGVNIPAYVNLGLNASDADYVDIIARSVQVLGDIHSKKEVNFKLGNGTYDYANKTISSNSNLGVATKPNFALDSSYLGGIYAGKISLTATEEGVGVKTRGDLVSDAGDIVFDVAGDIDYKRIKAKTDIKLNSISGKITQFKDDNNLPAITNAEGNINFNGKNGIELNDSSQSSNFYALGAISLNSAGNIKNNSTIKAEAGLFIDSQSFENTSRLFSAENLVITTSGLAKNSYGDIESLKNIIINAGSLINSSLIKAGADATITSSGGFTDTNQIKADGNLSIIANNGIAYNDLYSGGNLSIANNISGDIRHNYKSYSLGTTTIINKASNNGGNIVFGLTDNSNSGSLYSKENLTIASSFDITNNIDIFSEGKIDLTAQDLINNMQFMAIGVDANSSDLTINLDQNLINYGLLYANQNINLNVAGTITNNASNNNAGEIFSLNGDVNINGNSYITRFGNVSKYDFFNLSFDKSQDIWNDLANNGYIDRISGKITDKFKISLLQSSDPSTLFTISSPALASYRDAIYQALTKISAKIVQSDAVCDNSASCLIVKNDDGSYNVVNSFDRIAKDFDYKAGAIYSALRNKGYIDINGEVTSLFWSDLKNSGGIDKMNISDDREIQSLKIDIYQLLSDTFNGKITENIFLNIKGLDTGEVTSGNNQGASLSSALISELKDKNYIDNEGNIINLPANANDLTNNTTTALSADFFPYKEEIFNILINAQSVNKASEDKFSDIAYKQLNNIDNQQKLYNELIAKGYINNGLFTNKFMQEGNNINIPANDNSGLILYKDDLKNIFLLKSAGQNFNLSDLSPITNYHALNDIDNSTKLLNQLKNDGFIDSKGNITEKFYMDGVASSNNSLSNYQNEIKNAVNNKITKAKIYNSSFRKINKSLDNSASRLISELINAGYLYGVGVDNSTENYGKKTSNFNFTNENEFANAFASVAIGGEFESVRSEIFKALSAKDDNYKFQANDFLGSQNTALGQIIFNSNTLFDENQLLFKNLRDNSYISNNGDIMESFYKLEGDYYNLNIDNRFDSLKGQIGEFINNIGSFSANLSNDKLISIASGNTKENAGKMFQRLSENGYINNKGDFEEKLMTEVINSTGSDQDKASRLNIGDFSADYAFGVYQKLKEIRASQLADTANKGISNGVEATSFATKLENLNGGKISSALGSVNIKALTFNNIAKDSANVNINKSQFDNVAGNPENGVIRVPHYALGRAWKNTILWGYDTVTSSLTSDPSFIRAGKNINITTGDIFNNSSVITAGNNIDLRADNLNNTKTQFTVAVPYIYQTHWKKCSRVRGCKSGSYNSWYKKDVILESKTPAIISAGNKIDITAINDLRVDKESINNNLKNTKIKQARENPQSPDAEDWEIIIPTANNGLFKKAPPDKGYLIESAYNTNDANSLTGSAYYKTRFGFDPNQNNIKWLGDPFYEWNIINSQILQITKKQNNWEEWAKNNGLVAGSNWQDNINKLIDNAYSQKNELNLVPGVKLTKEQITALKSDIIWYETKTIKLADGSTKQVAVPHIYLAKNSSSKIDLKNPEESIIISNNININAGGNVDNDGQIIANNNLYINSNKDINNSSLIKANNQLTLDALGNINNQSFIDQIIINHQAGTDIFSNIAKTAKIEAGSGNFNSKNFNNLASQIIINKNDLGGGILSDGNLLISTKDNLNIATLELTNRAETRWGDKKKGGHSINEATSNIASNILVAGSLSLNSEQDINITASNLSAGDSLNLIAKNNININNAQDNLYSLKETYKKGNSYSKKNLDIDQQTRNISSNLEAGNGININSGSNSNIVASNLDSIGSINIIAGKYFDKNIDSSTYQQEIYNKDAKINIISATENSYSLRSAQKTGIGGNNIKLSNDGLTFAQMNRNSTINSSSTQVATNINSLAGNINLITQNDLKIIASKINANLGNVNLISDYGNVDILSAYNNHETISKSLNVKNNLKFEINSRESYLSYGVEGKGSTKSINVGKVVSADIIGAKVNILAGNISDDSGKNNKNQGNINITSSNILSTNNSINLISANNINLLTATNFAEESNSSYNFSANIKAGIGYNFKDTWKSIEKLKDVNLKNAIKYIAGDSLFDYLGAGVASPYLATYGSTLLDVVKGNNIDESLAKNSDNINDSNIIRNAGKGGSGSASLSVELKYSQKSSVFKQQDVVSNNIFSNSDVNLTSSNSDLNIHSSNLNAENNINLNATKGDINILADTNNSNSFAKSFDITGSISLVGKGGGVGVPLSKSSSESQDYVNSSLVAGNNFNLNSGNNTNIIASNIIAQDINILTANNLNLESKQNIAKSEANSFGIGAGFNSSGAGNSVNANLSYSKSVANRNWADNQASIIGTNSITINTGNNTNIIGAVIANSTNGKIGSDAIDGGNLTLNTNSLTYTNLYDSDFARSFAIGAGAGIRAGSSTKTKGNASLSLNYSMHDFEQTTNAVIGNGTIKTGTILNLDANNNLISVAGGTDYSGDINRNISESQVLTKSLTVDPINIKETFEFGRNSTESQMKADNKSINNRTLLGDIKQSGSATSLVSNIGSGLMSSVGDTLTNLAYQINPLRGFSNITDGISTDIRNIRAELGLQTIALNVGQERQFITIDKDGNQIGGAFTLADYLADPSLAANKLFSNGIMNNLTEAISNAQTQLRSTDENGRITILFDPTAAPDGPFKKDPWGNIGGLLADLGEVSVNYLGANVLGGLIQTRGQATDEQFITAVTNNAKLNGTEITLAGHSGGGLRNYLTLANSNQNQYLDINGNSVLKVQFSGTPVSYLDMIAIGNYAGVGEVKFQNNSGDFVGNVLGMNGDVLDAIVSSYGSTKLFGNNSPHSNYGCILSNCYSGQITNPIPKPNSQ